ncbi:hypothetical protein [Amycolatopsis tolypomycina]|uniref:Mom family adenine methylcarbamoylation protein n=1 Tax=Amycolatopsis tolypomycina TaxID=208445 RepID=UPI0033B1FCDD
MPAPSAPTRTQRWREKSALYRPAGEDGFDAGRYAVAEIPKATGKTFVTAHHYTGVFPQTRFQFGLFDTQAEPNAQLVGVISLGNGSHPNALTNPFPQLAPYEESLDLNRMVLRDSVPANGESWFAARALRLAAEHGVRGVIAFSDPSEFWQPGPDGQLVQVKRGHYGVAYQGLNMDYLGQTRPSWKDYFPDGIEWNRRSISKVANGEVGADGVVARLVARGAPPLTADLDPGQWIERAKRACGITRRWHEGNHKYAVRIGRTRGERTRSVIGLAARPYPKPTPPLFLHGMDGVAR